MLPIDVSAVLLPHVEDDLGVAMATRQTGDNRQTVGKWPRRGGPGKGHAKMLVTGVVNKYEKYGIE